MNTYRIALESARTEEFVRMVNVYVEMDTVANSVSKKVSDYPILIIFFQCLPILGEATCWLSSLSP